MKASECKCCECGRQAVAFYPVIDPDIPSYPYCRTCLDKAKMELARKIWGDNGEMLAIAKEVINENKEKEQMNHVKKCAQCIYFTESVGYCSLHDRDVTRYNGCKDCITEQEYQDYET